MIYDYKMKNYLAQIPYLISHYIYEYDISKANLNILFNKGVINENDYEMIKSFPRSQRNIYFGMMQKDPVISETLNEGLSEFRKRFLEENEVEDWQLLSVKNDAIFLIDKIPKILEFDNITFIQKNVYTSYYNINKLEVYYSLDVINDKEILDVKGINDIKLESHKGGMINFLCSVFDEIQTGSLESTITLINAFYTKYVSLDLPSEYYREFNSDSKFRISLQDGTQYLLDMIDEKNKPYLNIITNLNVVKDLQSIVSGIYFNKR